MVTVNYIDFSSTEPENKNFLKKKVIPVVKKALPVVKQVLPVASTLFPALKPVAAVVSVIP